jgi:hypothetical protein
VRSGAWLVREIRVAEAFEVRAGMRGGKAFRVVTISVMGPGQPWRASGGGSTDVEAAAPILDLTALGGRPSQYARAEAIGPRLGADESTTSGVQVRSTSAR